MLHNVHLPDPSFDLLDLVFFFQLLPLLLPVALLLLHLPLMLHIELSLQLFLFDLLLFDLVLMNNFLELLFSDHLKLLLLLLHLIH
mmetsp:Transcript_13606/g.13348  ORF Transcript_13606/g.13348 Transcript_13606/m.13348 type:complete len:86 (-) Transcript_13606:376-633(-)